ncbi:MAG: nuclease-related domain-containing protein [Friedmanniella sp.]
MIQSNAASVAASPPSIPNPHAQPVLERPWTDLTANVPGAAARAQARALRDAAPIRTFFARLVNLRTRERAWRIGADGEERVGAELAKLVKFDPRWRVLHAVPVGNAGADIDHLVIGPGGIFTLNTKHHPGAALWVGGDTFMVNGQRQPYVRKSRYEAGRAARLLMAASGNPLRVDEILVPVGARSLTIKTAPADVAVVPRRQLTAWLLGWGSVLDERTLTIVSEVARRSTTWQSR